MCRFCLDHILQMRVCCSSLIQFWILSNRSSWEPQVWGLWDAGHKREIWVFLPPQQSWASSQQKYGLLKSLLWCWVQFLTLRLLDQNLSFSSFPPPQPEIKGTKADCYFCKFFQCCWLVAALEHLEQANMSRSELWHRGTWSSGALRHHLGLSEPRHLFLFGMTMNLWQRGAAPCWVPVLH